MRRRRRNPLYATLILAFAVTFATACGSADAGGPATPDPKTDVLSGVVKDEAIAAQLPAAVRQAGVVRFATSVGSTPPSAYYAEDNKTVQGQDIDIAEAVAKVLGIRIEREVASFEAILPALTSGKYEVGTGNFGVTEARKKTIDFVTYVNDGQGFAVRKDDSRFAPGGADNPIQVKSLTQLCGLKIGTGTGTTFEATLEREKHVCPDAGKPEYQVLSFSENAAIFLGLQQQHIDVVMSTINGLRYATTQQPNLRFLNEFKRLDVGFAFKKGSELTPAFQSAVNKLIEDGTYRAILAKWGTEGSSIPKSQVSPPEHV